MSTETWPKTKSGTIDWDVVFENPETGLIPLISNAGSVSALRDSALAVVTLLYSRDDDPPVIERFSSELKGLIPDDTPDSLLPQLVDGVTAILRQIKDERMRKAEEFSDNKNLAEGGEKREIAKQVARKTAKAKAEAEKAKQKKRQLIYGVVGGIAAATVLSVITYFVATGENKEDKSTFRVLIEEMKGAVDGEAIKTHTFNGSLQVGAKAGRVTVSAVGIPPYACSSAAWFFANRGNVIINNVMPQRISPKVLAELCAAVPAGATLTWISKKKVP